MEIFRNTNFDFLGKKWPFIIASLVLTAAGLTSLIMKGGPRYGIDFRGGATMDVQFAQPPQADRIRTALAKNISGEITVQNISGTANGVVIGTELKSEKELQTARSTMVRTLEATFRAPGQAEGKLDLNNAGQTALEDQLRDPLARASAGLSDQQLKVLAGGILTFRDHDRSGLLRSIDEVRGVAGVTPQVLSVLKDQCYLAPFNVKRVEVVGPKVGGELRTQAILATLYALGGMLVYIGFRFEWIYGAAAVIAVFHDTVITIGLFSVFDKEISLTVIAALLTLVGYSMNDTIVVFDRIRENLKILRRESLTSLINLSINQTLSRTILTSGLTFLTVIALFLFGGQVLHGFSFALVVGIIIGTYSSIFIASPILVAWQDFIEKRKTPGAARGVEPAPAARRSSPAKAAK
jgi:preprotein translocase subunit SecF